MSRKKRQTFQVLSPVVYISFQSLVEASAPEGKNYDPNYFVMGLIPKEGTELYKECHNTKTYDETIRKACLVGSGLELEEFLEPKPGVLTPSIPLNFDLEDQEDFASFKSSSNEKNIPFIVTPDGKDLRIKGKKYLDDSYLSEGAPVVVSTTLSYYNVAGREGIKARLEGVVCLADKHDPIEIVQKTKHTEVGKDTLDAVKGLKF